MSFPVFEPDLREKRYMEKEKFEMFATLLEKEKVYMYPGVTFRKVCGWIGADALKMDLFLESELGYGGDEIMRAYRSGTVCRFKAEYGIEL